MIDIRKTKEQLNKFLTECASTPKKVLKEGTDDWMGISGAWGEDTIDGTHTVIETNADLSECTIHFGEKQVTVRIDDYEITDEDPGFEGHISAWCTTDEFEFPGTNTSMTVSFGVDGSKRGGQWAWDTVDVWNMETNILGDPSKGSPNDSKPDVTAPRGSRVVDPATLRIREEIYSDHGWYPKYGSKPKNRPKADLNADSKPDVTPLRRNKVVDPATLRVREEIRSDSKKSRMAEAGDGKYREDGVRVYKQGEKPDNGPLPGEGEKPDWTKKPVKTYSADEMSRRMNTLKKVTARELPANWAKYAEEQGYDISKASDDATTMVNHRSSNPVDVNELMYQILKDIEQPTKGMPSNFDNFQKSNYIIRRENNLRGLFQLLWPEKYEELAMIRYNKWGFRSGYQRSN